MGEHLSPQEAYPEPSIAMPAEAAINIFSVPQAVSLELPATPLDEVSLEDMQEYEYTRQDGTVERAANRQEAIALCPVLGKLVLEDPTVADLLLDIASLGQSKMQEQPAKAEHQERPMPKEPKHADRESAAQEDTEPRRAEVFQPETVEAAQVVPPDVRVELEVADATVQTVKPKPTAIIEPPMKLHEESPREATATRVLAEAMLSHEDIAILEQLHAERASLTTHPSPIQKHETIDRALPQWTEMPLHTQADTIAEHPPLESRETLNTNTAELEVAAMVDTVFAEQGIAFPSGAAEEAEVLPYLDYSVPSFIDGYTEVSETTLWAVELEAEPQAFYGAFVEAMHSLITLADDEILVSPELATAPDSPPDSTESYNAELQPLPAIATIVIESLDACRPPTREAVAPILQTIMTTVQTLEAIETGAKAEPEIAETAMVQLEAQVATLFEELGIAPDVAAIEQFIQVLRRSDFQPAQQEATEMVAADLEHDGTHEAKLHFTQIVSDGLTDIECEARQLLGRFIILCSHGETRSQLAFN